jgi:energy-coupling factor transporter ATP-binding protein EcfA2
MAAPPAVPTPSFPRGSEWRKWDLHIHSPLSALNNQFPQLIKGEPDWNKYIAALESLTDISVIGITDYFTVEGYRKVREYRNAGRLGNIKLVLPNIEFRLDKIINTSGGPRRINYHVLFSDALSPDEIDEHFLQELKFRFEGDPQRPDFHLSARRTNLELLGRQLKREHAAFNDGRSDFEIGCMNATVDPSEIKRVVHNNEKIFKGKYLIVLAEEHLGLLDWNGQDHLTRKILLQGADGVFSANPRTVGWTRGDGDLTPEQFEAEFKSLKPCLHGSDAHCLPDIGKPAMDRYCWIKADTTFEGLKQVLYEPHERIYIGDRPANLKHDHHVIERIQITNAPSWFAPVDIPLNRDLVAIIGPRGSGKSALAEAIAFAGGAGTFHSSGDIQDSFLYKASKRSAANATPITGAKVSLYWQNGENDSVDIPSILRHGKEEEKVKYLPQKFVERLCAPENNQQLEEEIERVIFQRINKTDRQDASNFRELRQASTTALQLRRQKLIRNIQALNQSIADTHVRIALKPGKERELKQKQTELQALMKNAPQVPQANKQELQLLETLVKEKQTLEQEITRLTQQVNTLDAIGAKFDVLKDDLASFNTEIISLLESIELSGEKDKFQVCVPIDVVDILGARRRVLADAIEVLKTGRATETAGDAPAEPPANLQSIEKRIEELRAQSKLTEAKRNEYDKFQKDRQQLETSINALEREIKEIIDILTPRAKAEAEARIERYLDCFGLLKEERAILEKLYEPLRDALLASNEIAKKLTFVSRVTFAIPRHASKGSELLDRRKAVIKDEEEMEEELKKYFDQIEGANFERNEIRSALNALREAFLAREGNRVRIEDQLRKDRTAKDFADWFYGTDDFAVTYSIKFDGKDLHLLSPGEKGIVLLLLYLEAENEDNRPLIIDQPDDNLDNVSVYPSLIEYFRTRKRTRQVVIITHNPNLVVNTDAEQVFVASFDGSRSPKVSYRSGALEDTNPTGPTVGIKEEVCKILEGGTKAFQLREQRYAIT